MDRIKKSIWITLLLSVTASVAPALAQKSFVLSSPDQSLHSEIQVSDTGIRYNVKHANDLMLDFSRIYMTLDNGRKFGVNPKLTGTVTNTVDRILTSDVYKKKEVRDHFNELILKFKGNYQIVFRAYNEGIAYRFISSLKGELIVENELAEFNFPADNKAYIPYVRDHLATLESQFSSSFENVYAYENISQWDRSRMAFLPLLVEGVSGKKVCILEADLLDYPGMFLYNDNGSNSLKSVFAPYPKDIEQGGYLNLQGIVKTREPYIAKVKGATSFPWRVITVSSQDAELPENDMVFKLATQPQGDFSWVKPGQASWDWWNSWNLFGVDFKAGINNETYKYYIDFASKYNIPYVILDDGWSPQSEADLFKVVPQLDIPLLVEYGKQRNVRLILWAGYYPFERDMEAVCKHYSDMGIAGFKVDYMERDDQLMVDFHRRAAEVAARYHLLLDLHGTYKPTGLQRTYPNVVNVEGVHGLEQMKFPGTTADQVTYDVTIPFIRMIAGPMDYTPGAMRNASKENFRTVHDEPLSQGTRCHQLAAYIVFDSPLNMLCDSPSSYEKEEECIRFLASIPTVWDDTKVLMGKVSELIVTARQKEDVWYVGCLNNWEARDIELDLSFLGEGDFKMELFSDGVNADRCARDYKKEIISIPADRKLKVTLASGGGMAARIYK
ncbi:glycoside hydrolase family 97 protein [Bacteroides sp.]|uniref:glycoside hydrolase family 97 protein n=1 Tax=Bacteroides sp. TaxID=29523 RepID=UPI003AB44B0E